MRTGESRACALARAPLSRPAVAHAASPSLSLSHTSLLVVCSLTRAALATRFINPEGLDAIEGVFPAEVLARWPALLRRLGGYYATLALAGSLLLSNPPQSDKSYPHVGKGGNAAGSKPIKQQAHRTQLATPAPRGNAWEEWLRATGAARFYARSAAAPPRWSHASAAAAAAAQAEVAQAAAPYPAETRPRSHACPLSRARCRAAIESCR